MKKVLLTPVLNDPHYDSDERQAGIAELAKLALLEGYTHKKFTAEHGSNVIAIIANSALFTRQFYEVAADLRLVARWGVGYDKVNLEGGAIALGHPLGASGARITGKAAQLLKRSGGKHALATLCVGGGMGMATVLEQV